MSGNIYVIDALSKQIKVVSYDGSSVRTVVQFMIDRPRAVAVHPGKGYVCVHAMCVGTCVGGCVGVGGYGCGCTCVGVWVGVGVGAHVCVCLC